MTSPWQPEFVICADLAKRLIEKQFPALAPARLEPWVAGWDNTVFLVNDRFVFRFPRKKFTTEFILKENAVLPRLRARLPLEIPVPTYIGKPEAEYDWPFSGYERLAGETLCRGFEAREAIVRSLAEFLRALHAIPIAEGKAWGLGEDAIGRVNPTRLRKQSLENLEKAGLSPERWLEILQIDYAADPTLRIVHGDLYSRHFLIGEDGVIRGVIDWGDMHIGNPAVDLASAFLILPPSLHSEFRGAYGDIAETTWKLARLRAFFHATATLVYSKATNDAALRRESERALGWLVVQSSA